ncbi:MAG TPA: 50S ribosomal protein L30 [Candidatus Desulfovibrio intestinipullorum]|uniref:50S ribosomal protein L30 n=1 Tax=Candidatus Desulfovibrio intestinipullorum TaxID=2838536 RepID=A0A9D1PW04_9BACT|nr:50S ribosomal protein L30 [Candidatus Desulfovibrio intestinipullorum]
MAEQITVMLVRSRAGCTPAQRKCLDALGLRRREVRRTITDSPAVRGIINKVPHLVAIVK